MGSRKSHKQASGQELKTCGHRPLSCGTMLSLRGIQSFVSARQASPRRKFSGRFAVQKQSFLFS